MNEPTFVTLGYKRCVFISNMQQRIIPSEKTQVFVLTCWRNVILSPVKQN